MTSESNATMASLASEYEAYVHKDWVDFLRRVKDYCTERGIPHYRFMPRITTTNREEARIAARIHSYRNLVLLRLHGRLLDEAPCGREYKSVTALIAQHFPHWLDPNPAAAMLLEQWRHALDRLEKAPGFKAATRSTYFPSFRKGTAEEREVYTLLSSYRKAVREGHAPAKVTALLEKRYPHWIEWAGVPRLQREQVVLQRWQEHLASARCMCDRRGVPYASFRPSPTSKDPEEQRLAVSLQHYRSAFHAQDGKECFPEVTEMINATFPLWLLRQEEVVALRWRKAIEDSKRMCDERGILYADFYPNLHAKDEAEYKVAKRLANYKAAHMGTAQLSTHAEVDRMILDSPFVRWHAILVKNSG